MPHITSKVDLGESFERLAAKLKKNIQTTTGNTGEEYALAFGRLSMAVKKHLVECTDWTLKDIQDYIDDAEADDIPPFLFRQVR